MPSALPPSFLKELLDTSGWGWRGELGGLMRDRGGEVFFSSHNCLLVLSSFKGSCSE